MAKKPKTKKVLKKKRVPRKVAPKKLLKKRVSKKTAKKKFVRVKRVKITKEQIEAFIKKGSERGFVTTSEILYTFPNIEDNVDELEKMYDELKERGV